MTKQNNRVLSLEEIEKLKQDFSTVGPRLIHTAREYHRLREALEISLKHWEAHLLNCSGFRMESIDDFGPGRIDVNEFKKAREALKEIEGE